MYVFDTDVLIEFLRGHLPEALEMLNRTDSNLVKVPAVVEAELLTGALKSKNALKSRDAVIKLLMRYEVLQFDEQCAQVYARLRTRLEGKGMKVDSNDLMIASITIVHNATLVTNNLRHYSRIEELHLLSLREVEF